MMLSAVRLDSSAGARTSSCISAGFMRVAPLPIADSSARHLARLADHLSAASCRWTWLSRRAGCTQRSWRRSTEGGACRLRLLPMPQARGRPGWQRRWHLQQRQQVHQRGQQEMRLQGKASRARSSSGSRQIKARAPAVLLALITVHRVHPSMSRCCGSLRLQTTSRSSSRRWAQLTCQAPRCLNSSSSGQLDRQPLAARHCLVFCQLHWQLQPCTAAHCCRSYPCCDFSAHGDCSPQASCASASTAPCANPALPTCSPRREAGKALALRSPAGPG